MNTAFDWEPARVMVVWPDNTYVGAKIVEPHTTVRGPVQAGVTLRLSIRLDKDGPDGLPKHLVLGGPYGIVRIPVRGA